MSAPHTHRAQKDTAIDSALRAAIEKPPVVDISLHASSAAESIPKDPRE
jgi:hypothetical protein